MFILNDNVPFFQYCKFNFSKTCHKFRISENIFFIGDSKLIFHAKDDGVLSFRLKLKVRFLKYENENSAKKFPKNSKLIPKKF